MDKVKILRKYERDYTAGVLIAIKKGRTILIANTIELPWRDNQRMVSCIPEGEYKVRKHYSPKFKDSFEVLNVEGRDNILLHPANFVFGEKVDLQGCIAPVSYLKDINGDLHLDGVHSREIMNFLLKNFPNGFDLEIKELCERYFLR